MRNTKLVPVSVLSTLALLVLLVVWHSEISMTPVISNKGSDHKEGINASVARGFIKKSHDFEHLGFQKVVYSKSNYSSASKNSVLITSSVANENSFGRERSFKDFYDVIGTLNYPKELINLSFYCGSPALHQVVEEFFEAVTKSEACPYNKVTILYAPFLQSEFKSSEHNPKVQRLRRRSIARGRNFVLLNSLEEEHFTLFLDADIVRFDHTDMLARFVRSEKDIIVPRVERGGSSDYDRNSWRGHRKTPSDEQLKLMDQDKWDEADFMPEDVEGKIYHLGAQVDDIRDLPSTDSRRDLSYLVDLDSVGGAVLFAKSIIYKQGVIFPTMNVVGTTWDRKEGYDGIETEGVCYMAQTMGYKCYAMPNLVAQHFDR